MTRIISLRDISKTYVIKSDVKVEALKGITLDIDEGEFVAITGPSGSGKSTLLKIIGCISQPTSGEFILGEEDLSRASKKKLADIRNNKIGFVFQNFELIDEYTVYENIELPILLKKRRRSHADTVNAVNKAMELCSIRELSKRRVDSISGGQRQRAAIARALINEAPIILADEPTGALDSNTANQIFDLLDELNKQGKTVVLVTHNEEFALKARRQIKMVDGEVISDGKE